jgi:hypothetical protein
MDYHADGPHRNELLYTANWNWHGRMNLQIPQALECDTEEFIRLIQSEMFQPTSLTLHLLSKTLTATLGTADEPYGAIMLRTQIDYQGIKKITNNDILKSLRDCTAQFPNMKWIMMADEMSTARALVEEFEPKGVLFTHYDKEFEEMNQHSFSVRDEWQHKYMAGSVIDWWVIAHSTAALTIGHTQSAFGTTGIMNDREKHFVGTCGQEPVVLDLYKRR